MGRSLRACCRTASSPITTSTRHRAPFALLLRHYPFTLTCIATVAARPSHAHAVACVAFRRGAPQWLVGKHDGNLCRMRPHVSSIANVLTHYGCKDEAFADFIGELLQLDPERRPSAEETLKHAWLQGNTPCAKYQIADSGEAGKRLRTKYPSLANVGESPSKASSSGGGNGEEVPGPATPTSFREQCYLDRERGEKKRSRKSAAQRLSSTGECRVWVAIPRRGWALERA